MQSDFKRIHYLRHGNPRQQGAYEVLTALELFTQLSEFDPVLTGTIPIEIDIPTSDLDISCFCSSGDYFQQVVTNHYGHQKNFEIKTVNTVPTATVARFEHSDFVIELFGQNTPTVQQAAYLHMIKEYEILQRYGEAFRKEVIELKKGGLKTEPAFAKLLGIKGDPYQELLKYDVKLQ